MGYKDIEKAMHSEQIYAPSDLNTTIEQMTYIQKVNKYNKTPATYRGLKKRTKMLNDMFFEIGQNCYIEPPFHASWADKHVHFGNNVYVNFNLVMVDDTHIYIGDNCLIGPNVTLATAQHPIPGELRIDGLQYNKPIHIGENVWIGAGSIILPGVMIGDNSIIGAGSIVTKSIPSDVVAFGNPCKVIRKISKEDYQYYDHNKKYSDEIIDHYFKVHKYSK